jgi:hypothetical protein
VKDKGRPLPSSSRPGTGHQDLQARRDSKDHHHGSAQGAGGGSRARSSSHEHEHNKTKRKSVTTTKDEEIELHQSGGLCKGPLLDWEDVQDPAATRRETPSRQVRFHSKLDLQGMSLKQLTLSCTHFKRLSAQHVNKIVFEATPVGLALLTTTFMDIQDCTDVKRDFDLVAEVQRSPLLGGFTRPLSPASDTEEGGLSLEGKRL